MAGTYTVSPNDSWASIAGKIYGSQRWLIELANANGGMGRVLQPGDVIALPDFDTNTQPYISPDAWANVPTGVSGGQTQYGNQGGQTPALPNFGTPTVPTFTQPSGGGKQTGTFVNPLPSYQPNTNAAPTPGYGPTGQYQRTGPAPQPNPRQNLYNTMGAYAGQYGQPNAQGGRPGGTRPSGGAPSGSPLQRSILRTARNSALSVLNNPLSPLQGMFGGTGPLGGSTRTQGQGVTPAYTGHNAPTFSEQTFTNPATGANSAPQPGGPRVAGEGLDGPLSYADLASAARWTGLALYAYGGGYGDTDRYGRQLAGNRSILPKRVSLRVSQELPLPANVSSIEEMMTSLGYFLDADGNWSLQSPQVISGYGGGQQSYTYSGYGDGGGGYGYGGGGLTRGASAGGYAGYGLVNWRLSG